MSTDVNDFDKYLKQNLYRDLLFRSVSWLLISAATGYIAIYYGGSTALFYFERVGNTFGPLVNSIGAGSVLLCIIALFLKDFEVVSKNIKFTAATRGMCGGFVRRLAGDISLWTLGATIALIAAMTLALLNTPISKSEVGSIIKLAVILVRLTIVMAVGNVLVRRSGPSPWVKNFHNPTGLIITYALVFIILTVVVLHS